jgi:hypothetical protein
LACILDDGTGLVKKCAGNVADRLGAGGVAGTGDITYTGMPGCLGFTGVSTGGVSMGTGAGGSTLVGSGGAGRDINASPGNPRAGRGSGGSGGSALNGASNQAGGAGAAGYVVITEFCNQ